MFKLLFLIPAMIVSGLASGPLPGSSSAAGPARPVQEPAPATAPGAAPVPTTIKNPVKATPESQAHAKKIYSYDCEMCHAASGDGKTDLAKEMNLTLKDWTDPQALAGMTDGQLFDIIRDGKGKMTGEGDRAKPDVIWNLIIYIRKMAKAPTDGAKPGR